MKRILPLLFLPFVLNFASCGTTPEQRRTIAVQVGSRVLEDVANGAQVYLTTGSGQAAGTAMLVTGVKQLPALTEQVSQVLATKNVPVVAPSGK